MALNSTVVIDKRWVFNGTVCQLWYFSFSSRNSPNKSVPRLEYESGCVSPLTSRANCGFRKSSWIQCGSLANGGQLASWKWVHPERQIFVLEDRLGESVNAARGPCRPQTVVPQLSSGGVSILKSYKVSLLTGKGEWYSRCRIGSERGTDGIVEKGFPKCRVHSVEDVMRKALVVVVTRLWFHQVPLRSSRWCSNTIIVGASVWVMTMLKKLPLDAVLVVQCLHLSLRLSVSVRVCLGLSVSQYQSVCVLSGHLGGILGYGYLNYLS
ncbi:hypothetical protein B0I73DRAFT_162046 [Yarrowia lipolytica]|nr:hypothetical protein B0I73DRAFT_162046 [Yarrowia lipolytica]